MADWQPIDTAPRDGTEIIVGTSAQGSPGRVFYGWFFEAGEWGDHDGSAEDILSAGEWVSHWMPLITPPDPRRAVEGETV